MANSLISVRIDENVKMQASEIFEEMGLDMSTAINIYLRKVIACQGIPFEVKIMTPTDELKKAIEEGQKILNGEIPAKRYEDVDELFKDLKKD